MTKIKCPDCQSLIHFSEDCTEISCDHCKAVWHICPRCKKILGEAAVYAYSIRNDCPECGQAKLKISCPVCETKNFSDTKQCPKCQTEFIVIACPICYDKVIVHPDLEKCPLCESFYHNRCTFCQTPYVYGGKGDKCAGCGKFI
jgi:hypothetical protein